MNKYLLTLSCFVLSACMTETKREIEIGQKISKETTTARPGEAATNSSDLIEASKSLSLEQKAKIREIILRTQVSSQALRTQSSQLTTAVFKSVSDGTYQAYDVGIIKKKISKLENKRRDLLFASLDQVQKILGYTPTGRDRDFEVHELFRDY